MTPAGLLDADQLEGTRLADHAALAAIDASRERRKASEPPVRWTTNGLLGSTALGSTGPNMVAAGSTSP